MVVVHRAGAELTRWGVPLDDRSDLEVIEELANVALAAKRSDVELVLHVFCARLASIIDLVGLRDALSAVGPAAMIDEIYPDGVPPP